jgi:glycosyltransferase involved in cell wall biosynthesis
VNSGRVPDTVALEEGLARGTIAPVVVTHVERFAIERSELTVTHADGTRDLLQHFFPGSITKIYPEVVWFEWICDGAAAWRHHAREFAARDIDILFVAADWGRREKNYEGVEAIAARLGDARIHIVGDVPHEISNAVHHGFLESRDALFQLMGRARCVASPSRADAAPGILYEASVLDCNIVATRNCGNWEICHPDLLAESLAPDVFAACCRRAIERKYDDGLQLFLSRGSYRRLLSIIEAFRNPIVSVPAA